MRICVLLRSFVRGGAERQAALTAAEMKRRGHEVEVVAFHNGSAYQEILDDEFIQPIILSGSRIGLPWRVWLHLKGSHPDIVLSYLAGPNILALLGRCTRRGPRIVWGVRSTSLELSDEAMLSRLVVRIEPHLSRWCHLAVANSFEGRQDAVGRGFMVPAFEVVPNGIDSELFAPRPAARGGRRVSAGLDSDAFVIGRVGRIHPMKDLPTLFLSLAMLRDEGRSALVAVVGDGEPQYLDELRQLVEELSLTEYVRWMGASDNVADDFAIFDITVSSSAYGEGFPNAIAESLASGIPCIGTDVGDTRLLLRNPRQVVPPGSPELLAAAIADLMDMSDDRRAAIGAEGRRLIEDEYSLESLGSRLESILKSQILDLEG